MDLVLPGDDPYIRFVYEDEEPVRQAHWHPLAGDVVLDVGSHYGSYTVPALAAGASVIAMEPRREFSDRMLAIMAATGISGARLTLVPGVLAAAGGYPAEFWQGLAAGPCQDEYATPDMPFTTLDELADRVRITWLDWVKIDTEGAELGVLQGGLDSLKRFRPRMLIEEHGGTLPFVAALGIPRACLDLLGNLGYQVKTVHFPGGPHHGFTSVPRDFWVCTP